MIKVLGKIFREASREAKLEACEEKLRKYDEQRAALKAKAMLVQKEYDELRAQK